MDTCLGGVGQFCCKWIDGDSEYINQRKGCVWLKQLKMEGKPIQWERWFPNLMYEKKLVEVEHFLGRFELIAKIIVGWRKCKD